MKLLSFRSLGLAAAFAGVLLVAGCSKKSFKSEPGLYGTKQYHNYRINILAHDTARLKDVRIKIMAVDNSNYLSWDNMLFHLSSNKGDTVHTYINDSLIGGTRHILFTLTYHLGKDEVSVVNEDKDLYWFSF